MQDELETPNFLRGRWEDSWEDLARNTEAGLGFVSEDAGHVTGFVAGTISRERPELLHATNLYVVPDARRAGIARALLHALVAAAQEREARHVGLDVQVDNAPATTLVRRLGFVDNERFMTAELDSVLERTAQMERPPSVASTHVQTDDEEAVERALQQFMPRLGRSARTEVTPPRNGWV